MFIVNSLLCITLSHLTNGHILGSELSLMMKVKVNGVMNHHLIIYVVNETEKVP